MSLGGSQSSLKLEYLESFLNDEFSSEFEEKGIRIKRYARAGVQRSPDLEQDYNPEAVDLHYKEGVIVKSGARDYFFSTELANPTARPKLEALIAEIRKRL